MTRRCGCSSACSARVLSSSAVTSGPASASANGWRSTSWTFGTCTMPTSPLFATVPVPERSAVVDRHRVDQLLALLGRYVRILRELAEADLDEFIADPRNYGSAERFLQLAIECTLSIGHHLAAAEGLEQPTTYAEVYDILGRAGILEPDFAARLRPMARMRNRLVHVYEDVTPALVHRVLLEDLGDFDEFARQITVHLDGLA